MPKARKSSTLDASTFGGLELRPDARSTAFTVQHNHRLVGQKKRRKLTLNRVITSGFRKNHRMLREAVENKVVLNFRMSEFRADRAAEKMSIADAKLYPGLTSLDTFKSSDKARLFVDLDDEIVFGHFPNYIGKVTQDILTGVLGDLVRVCPPRADRQKGDRRVRKGRSDSGHDAKSPGSSNVGTEDPDEEGEEGIENQDDEDEDWTYVDEEFDPELAADFEDLGSDNWSSGEAVDELAEDMEGLASDEQHSPLYRCNLPPSSYYHAAGWYATGQERVRQRPNR
ncbi:hypothetical protein FRC08_014446 [Ceratobasidium sp. 394]|nr:hypothetical protein FRC08_014446 [Ceratobasidium sp. 394]